MKDQEGEVETLREREEQEGLAQGGSLLKNALTVMGLREADLDQAVSDLVLVKEAASGLADLVVLKGDLVDPGEVLADRQEDLGMAEA